MNNPFLEYQPPGRQRRPMKARVVKSDADAPMMPTAMEKAQRDKSTQMRLHREYWREQLNVAFRSEHGSDMVKLNKFLRQMAIDDGDALIDLVKRSKLPRADVHTRYAALRLVTDGLARLRVQNGLAPFDDSLPDEPPTVFEIIRAELGVP